MTPITPIIPGADVPTVTFAENQPEYIPLPAYRAEDGMVVTRWRLTWRERLRVFLSGDLWLTLLTFNQPLQPVMLDTKCPIAVQATPPSRCNRESFWERHFGGHVSIGWLVIYGWNAMHVAVNCRVFGTFVCFHPTWRVFGKWWPWYFYISPDGTPNAATFKIGPGLFD